MLTERSWLCSEGHYLWKYQTNNIFWFAGKQTHLRNRWTLAGGKHSNFQIMDTSKAVVLKRDWFLPPKYVWKLMEPFLIVASRKRCAMLYLADTEESLLKNHPSRTALHKKEASGPECQWFQGSETQVLKERKKDMMRVNRHGAYL